MGIFEEIDRAILGISEEMTLQPINYHYIGFLLWKIKTKVDTLRMKEELDVEAMKILQKVVGLASDGVDVRKQLHDLAEIYKEKWEQN